MQRKPILIAVIVTGMLLTSAPAAQANETELASDVLDTLTVEPQTDDYNAADDRLDDWAQANDNPGDYSTTRDTILARDMTDVTYNDKHQVATGTLHDPYTGTTINFKRGQTTSNAVQIDHVVAFGEAWESGLGDDDEQTIERYYNDPYVLLAVDGPSNNGKQDSDAAEWLPSKVDADGKDTYDCYYVARQIGIKDKYDLSVDKAEKNAMSDVLATCPAQTIPSESDGAYWENADTGDTETLPGDVNGDGEYTTGDLPGLTVTVDGEPYKEFTPDTDSYKLPDGDHTVTIAGTPDGWTMTPAAQSAQAPMPDGSIVTTTTYAFTYTAPNGVAVASYTFTWGTVEHTDDGDDDTSDTPPVVDDTNTDNLDTNAGTDTVPDATDTDAPDGGNTAETPTDQLASTGATITGIGAFTLAMLCCGAALGVLLRRRTRN